MTVRPHGPGVGLGEGSKGGHELLEVALAGIALLRKGEVSKVAGLADLFDAGVDGEAGVVKDSGCGSGFGRGLDVEPMDLDVAVEPVACRNGFSVLAVDFVFAWSRSIECTGGVSGNGTGELEFDGRTLLSFGLELRAGNACQNDDTCSGHGTENVRLVHWASRCSDLDLC